MTVWRARVGEDGGFEPLEVQPEGGRRMAYAAWLRGLQVSAISPARRAAFAVLRRVFEDGAYADRALRVGVRPGSTSATARSRGSSRTAPSSACGRSTTRSRRSAAGPCGSSTRRCAPRSGSARYQLAFLDGVPRYAAVNESVELVRARPPRAGGPVHERRAAPARRRRAGALRVAARGHAAGGGAPALVSRLDRRDVVARPRRRTRRAR